MVKQLTPKVYWCGKVDWDLVRFHGDEYSIKRGSSYNSYLIKDKKTVLIDTVWLPYDEEFIANLKEAVDLKQIDYVIVNHVEVDHSGSLPRLLEEIPDVPIYCTANGARGLKAHYHKDWNIKTVKTGDTLDIGDSKLIFVEAPMLHWPDTMMTYMTGENILFSNDAFGQHYATESLYDEPGKMADIMAEAIKYYANILTPFSPQVAKKIDELLALNLPVSMICTSHGVIWKNDPMKIVETYKKWANAYSEDQVTIVYDTMWNSTRRMAEAIADGIRSVDANVTIKLFNGAKHDKNDIITEIFRSHTLVMGSSTINNGILFSISGLLEMIRGMRFKNKRAAAFGSYGWSGEAVKMINKGLEEAGFALVNEGLRINWVPDEEGLKKCFEFGRAIAKK